MPNQPDAKGSDPIRPWFAALESLGEFIGIRYGRVAPGSSEVDWRYERHSEVDGIGGFVRILRRAGLPVETVPQITHSAPHSWKPFFRSLPRTLGSRHRLAFRPMPAGPPVETTNQPAPAVAWHVFSEEETANLLTAGRRAGVTLNTFLLTHLDQAMRPAMEDPEATMPWMLPVNLRGKVARDTDIENQTSCVEIRIAPGDTAREVHAHIYGALERGEHWAAWKGYTATRILPQGLKRHVIKTDRALSQWNVGGFSNLGVWDPEGEITNQDLRGSWLFCPPVLRCQPLGIGCLSFQGRLSLLIQVHPDLTTAPEVPEGWMARWLLNMASDLDAKEETRNPQQSSRSKSSRPRPPQALQLI